MKQMTSYNFWVTTCDENGLEFSRPFQFNAMNFADAVNRSLKKISAETPKVKFKGLTYYMSAD
jgi:hypothetical protein